MLKRYLLLVSLLSLTLVACPQPEPQPTPKPVIASFKATPDTLPFGGGSSKLEWQITGADSISVDNGVGTVTGSSKDVNVTTTTTYTLTATNSGGSSTQAATVTVGQVQPLTKVSGTITPWTRGERLVKVTASVQGTAQNVLSGSMDVTGAFTVPLATPPTGALFPITSGFGTCATTVTATPVNTLIYGVSQLSVITTAGQPSGYLIHANAASLASPTAPTAGSKFVYYLYADTNSTLKGTCANPQSTSSIEIDLNLRQGWNATMVEQISATKIRFSNDPISSDVSWRFLSSGGAIVTITNPITSLEIGNSHQFTVSVKEPDGTPIANPEFVWTSSTPELIEVTASGLATAKAMGFASAATISVALKNNPGVGTSIYITTFGLEAVGGTYNLEEKTLGTAVRLRYVPLSGNPVPSGLNYTITGPTGWNNNQPLTGSHSFSADPFGILSEIPAVSGSYQISTNTISGTSNLTQKRQTSILFPPRVLLQYPITETTDSSAVRTQAVGSINTTFNVDTTKKLASVTNFKFNGFGIGGPPSFVWDSIPNFDPFANRLEASVKDQTTGQIVVSHQQVSYSPTTIPGFTADTSHTYIVYLTAIQGYQAGEVRVSRASALLDFHPEITQLGTSGGAKEGGYTITVTGFNFDINTSVFFGTTEATSKTLQGTASMQVVVPAGSVSTVDVKLSNGRGNSTVSAATKFRYYDIKEFGIATGSKLLAASGGIMYFVEEDSTRTPTVSLGKINAAGTITRVGLSGVSFYSLRDLALDASGNVWVAFETKLLRVSTTNAVTEVPLPTGVIPQMIAFGADGNIWIARSDSSNITRMQPDGTNAVSFTLAGSPQFGSSFSNSNEMILGPDSNLWFTNSSGYGRITSSGSITILNSNYYSAGGMIVYDGALLTGTSFSGLTRIETNGTTTPYSSACSSNRFAQGSDSAIWCAGMGFALSGDGLRRSVLTGTTSTNEGIALPSLPNTYSVSDLAADSTGKIWYLRGNKIGYITP